MIKEFQEVIISNPEKAKEKLNELENDRVLERATLKHRGTNKWNKQMKHVVSRNPELKKVVEDNLRLGRELKKRHDVEDDACDEIGDELEHVSSERIINVCIKIFSIVDG